MYSLNGVGTTLYGKREIDSDGSYVATKWFIIFLLPIFPLGSYRVWRGETKSTLIMPGAKTEYKMVKVDLNRKQIFNTYVVIWGSLILALYILVYYS